MPSKAPTPSTDPRLKNAYRFERAGWVYVHLEGSPAEIGFQHGYLLAPEIADGFKAMQFLETHDTKRDWSFFRETAQNVLWPHIEASTARNCKALPTDSRRAALRSTFGTSSR